MLFPLLCYNFLWEWYARSSSIAQPPIWKTRSFDFRISILQIDYQSKLKISIFPIQMGISYSSSGFRLHVWLLQFFNISSYLFPIPEAFQITLLLRSIRIYFLFILSPYFMNEENQLSTHLLEGRQEVRFFIGRIDQSMRFTQWFHPSFFSPRFGFV